MNFEIKSIDEWDIVVKNIIPNLKYNILLLKGDLGTGKTTFTQKLLRELGSRDEINSPTYSIVNEYDTPNGKVFHFDLYRLENLEEIFDIGIEEYLERGFLSIIEWPEIYEGELQGLNYHEMIIDNSLDNRKISFK